MTDTEILKKICSYSIDWEKSWQTHQINYHAIANIGREIVLDVKNQKNLDRVKNVLTAIEMILHDAQQNEIDLIGTGMFECMQTNALDEFLPGSMDALDEYFGPLSLLMWQDILEGWHGEGVRSMETYARILINGSVEKVNLHLYENDLSFELDGKSLGNDFTPFLSDRFIAHREYDDPITFPYAELIFNEDEIITIGEFVNHTKSERLIYDGTCRVHVMSTTRIDMLIEKLKLASAAKS